MICERTSMEVITVIVLLSPSNQTCQWGRPARISAEKKRESLQSVSSGGDRFSANGCPSSRHCLMPTITFSFVGHRSGRRRVATAEQCDSLCPRFQFPWYAAMTTPLQGSARLWTTLVSESNGRCAESLKCSVCYPRKFGVAGRSSAANIVSL